MRPTHYLVPSNQRPFNSGRWALSGRSSMEKHHVGVFTVGECQRKTTNQALQSSGSVASAVATHLAIVGRGFGSVPSVVFIRAVYERGSKWQTQRTKTLNLLLPTQ